VERVHDRDCFDKFTERARKTLSMAQEEAQRLNHQFIGAGRLLLGLSREPESVAAGVLASLGVQLEQVHQTALEIVRQQEGNPS
jgi:ATP-dependent Clp protease ATP-binding subunit ClpC